jgi:hypothetical protein
MKKPEDYTDPYFEQIINQLKESWGPEQVDMIVPLEALLDEKTSLLLVKSDGHAGTIINPKNHKGLSAFIVEVLAYALTTESAHVRELVRYMQEDYLHACEVSGREKH